MATPGVSCGRSIKGASRPAACSLSPASIISRAAQMRNTSSVGICCRAAWNSLFLSRRVAFGPGVDGAQEQRGADSGRERATERHASKAGVENP